MSNPTQAPVFKSFIETQFPVSKISKESYKERKAGSSQTLTGLGKWWGRKPLVLVRATVLGLLLPATNKAEKDREIFLKLMTMDPEGLWRRKSKKLSVKDLYERASKAQRARFFEPDSSADKPLWKMGLSKEDKDGLEYDIFTHTLSYDQKLQLCDRPEHLNGPSPEAWADINAHCGTAANSLEEWVAEMGMRQFGHVPRVGDAFCGGGSIPFEAARLGCEVYASDLNPAAALLTWAALNIVGGGKEVQAEVRKAQEEAFARADAQITEWGIEHNELGWRADAYLYCVEAQSPATGFWVPLAPSWVISEKYNVCAVPEPDRENKRYHLRIVTGATRAQMEQAKKGTVQNSELVCPETGQTFAIAALRGDRRLDGKTHYGLRLWENEDLVPRPTDVFQERLYCIRYVEPKGDRHYCEPNAHDHEREALVLQLLQERFADWQEQGFIPSKKIVPGYNTEQPIRERGWTHWHHLFNPRQLLVNGLLFSFNWDKYGTLSSSRTSDQNSRLVRWHPRNSQTANTFSNQALNTLLNYTGLGLEYLRIHWEGRVSRIVSFQRKNEVQLIDARILAFNNDFWITDPPYADAVNYHELGDFFLAWYEKQIPKLFPEWYADSRSALAVKGKGKGFNESMVECYSNFTCHMPDNGAQVVMFTHQDAAVWADLALILWASGLQVTAAWTIQTETDAVGIKTGNYVQGTVCMVLRKQRSEETAFLFDIQSDVELEVKKELDIMRALDTDEDPNFGDTDYQLAAYVAALRVITRYKKIEDIDVAYELGRERKKGETGELQKIIDSAVSIACEYLVPAGMPQALWRKLGADERFYAKALEIQGHGEYRNGVFMELARGFGLKEYKHLLKSGKANQTRLATPSEMGNKELDGGFGTSLLRLVLFAVRETRKNEDPKPGRQYLHDELPDYWNRRKDSIQLLEYLYRHARTQPEWTEELNPLHLLQGFLENDGV